MKIGKAVPRGLIHILKQEKCGSVVEVMAFAGLVAAGCGESANLTAGE